ncbi:hypothetical protein AgCh_020237 [Apium graveolens]
MNPPVLSKAKPGEPLSLYIAAGPKAVSSALVREEGGIHSPIYYVIQVLKDAETRYPNLEKFALALVHSNRKLRQYFQGREIRVVTYQQLRKIIHKPDASGRLVNWAIELSQFNIKFVPRTAIKAQVLAKFVIECTFPEHQPLASSGIAQEEANPSTDCWKLFVDGSSTTESSGAGLILISPEGFTIQQAITFAFKATNNQAEYETLISGLRLAKSLGIMKMIIYSDSQIVVKQTSGEYIVKDPKLAQYQAIVRDILETIPDITILYINREEISKADELSKLVQNTSDLTSSVYFEELKAPNTERSKDYNSKQANRKGNMSTNRSPMGRSSNSSSSVKKEEHQMCLCGRRARICVSWTLKNSGRRFYTCAIPKAGEGCHFFQWFEEDFCPRAMEMITHLNHMRIYLEVKLKLVEDDLADGVEKRKILKEERRLLIDAIIQLEADKSNLKK